jgi:hypothetical protein
MSGKTKKSMLKVMADLDGRRMATLAILPEKTVLATDKAGHNVEPQACETEPGSGRLSFRHDSSGI